MRASPAIGFLHVMPLVDLRVLDRLPLPRRPSNDDAIDCAGVAEPVVEPALVLGAESRSRRYLLGLHVRIPVHLHASTDRTAIAGRSFELELDPVTPWGDVVLIDQQRTALVGNDDVQCAAVAQIRQSDGATIVRVTGADCLRDVGKTPRSVVEPHALPLVTRETPAFH